MVSPDPTITLTSEGLTILNNTVDMFSGRPTYYDPLTNFFLVYYNYIFFAVGLFFLIYCVRRILIEKYGKKDPLDYEELE